MADKGRGGSPEEAHHAMGTAIFMGAGVLILLAVVWHVHRAVIVDPIFAVDWLDYKIAFTLGRLLSGLPIVYGAIGHDTLVDFAYVGGVLTGVNHASAVTLGDLLLVQTNVGRTVRIGAVVALIGMGVWLLMRNTKGAPRRKFLLRGWVYKEVTRVGGLRLPAPLLWLVQRLAAVIGLLGWLGGRPGHAAATALTRKLITRKEEKVVEGVDFIAEQAKTFRHVLTSVYFDIDKKDPRWREAETPLEWCLKQGITSTEDERFIELCETGLRRELGPTIESIRDYPVHARALLAIGWLHLTAGKEKSFALAGDLAEIIRPHEPFNADKVRPLIDPILNSTKPGRAIGKDPTSYFDAFVAAHTGINTAMLAMVASCGPFRDWGGGEADTLPPNTYLWLRGVDRPLWYTLQNIGCNNFRIEGEGPVHQFRRERAAGKRVPVDMAGPVRGIRAYFDGFGVTDLKDFEKQIQVSQR